MKLKILFNGFRHGHIYGLYNKVLTPPLLHNTSTVRSNSSYIIQWPLRIQQAATEEKLL